MKDICQIIPADANQRDIEYKNFTFLYITFDGEAGKVAALTLEAYAKILKDCIAVLPAQTVVHRITGDGAKKDLIAPLWSADKKKTLNFLNQYLK